MNAGALTQSPRTGWLRAWHAAALLLAATAAISPYVGASIRILFIIGCVIVGVLAWSLSPRSHLQVALTLFVFAPFVRRVVDLHLGFDPSGVMLTGPLLVLVIPAHDLWRRLDLEQSYDHALTPLFVVGACATYAVLLTVAQGEWSTAASNAIKWGAPLVYGMYLIQRHDAQELVGAVAGAFLVILPVIGLYGIWQYVDPPSWDQYWLVMAAITSAGLPEPYGVRTFSTMNGPASFATFTASGIMLVLFLRSGWRTVAAISPAALALLLTLYRTAWISLAVGILFCLAFRSARDRAAGALLMLGALAVAATVLTPFGDVITDRVATFAKGSHDASGQERLQQYRVLWDLPDSGLLGAGFGNVDIRTAGSLPIDGTIILCWMSMGIIVGLICLCALVAAAARTMAGAVYAGHQRSVVLGALACGALVQLPLANITSGELGFLFWTVNALACSHNGAGEMT